MEYFCNFPAFSTLDEKSCQKSSFFLYFLYFFLFSIFFYPCEIGANEKNGAIILQKSIHSIMSLKTIECSLRLNIVVDGIEYQARGKYEEQTLLQPVSNFQRSVFRQDVYFPMDMPSKPGDEANRMTIICHCSKDRQNGRIWVYKSIEGEKTLQFIRLAALEDAINRSEMQKILPTVGSAQKLGGLAGTLQEISNTYDFQEQAEQTVLDDANKTPVWKIKGMLKKVHFDRLINAWGGLKKKDQYPVELASDIEVHLGRNDFFPYKIRYLNRNSEKTEPNRIVSEVTYFDIMLNGEEIPEYRFTAFKQDGVFNFQDVTDHYIWSLGLK